MFELQRNHISVTPDLVILDDNPAVIEAYLETWFDVDEKFGIHTAGDDDVWVNFYAYYNTDTKDLTAKYIIEKPDSCEDFDYIPTDGEKQLITAMMEECCQNHYGCSLADFVNDINMQM